MPDQTLEQRCVNTLRTLAIDAVQAAGSGHAGLPMGMADAAFVLWDKFLKHAPGRPEWYDRDRFILSAGHGSLLLYSLLHLTGYDISLDDIKNFRQWNSKTPGHPEYERALGIETTTGPLGQGFATGIGMAMAEAHMGALYNTEKTPITNHYTYGIVSDGDLMEGLSHEAASLAGHLQLGKIIYLYDSNHVSIDGQTDLAFSEDVPKRFESYDWHVSDIDGHDRHAVEGAIKQAHQQTDKPSLIVCHTHIGFGSPSQDTADAHSDPLGEDNVRKTKETLGFDPAKKFFIPEEVLDHYRKARDRGEDYYHQWEKECEQFKQDEPDTAKAFFSQIKNPLPDDIGELLPHFEADAEGMATRDASGKVINELAPNIPAMFGGSADLTGSNRTEMEDSGNFEARNYANKNIHFGVRENAMCAAVNGMALHDGIVPFGGTFFNFSDYGRPSIRIAALSEMPSIFVLTHDSIGLGEDGPTHQPVEHMASFRAMPNALVLRPADANETAWAWKAALEYQGGPALLVLTRQDVPVFDRSKVNDASLTQKGAYILADSEKETPDVILIATGSEVQLALEASRKLQDDEVDARVVSMPSWKLFEEQDEPYRQKVLPDEVTARISVEAMATLGWERWIGPEGVAIGVDRFGASAPYKEIYQHYGITVEHIVSEAQKLQFAGM